MKKIYSTNQIIGGFRNGKSDLEVCATAEADFDEERSQLLIELDSFVRPVDLRSKETHLKTGWVPKKQSFTETVSPEQAPDLAREILHRWVHRIQQMIPSSFAPKPKTTQNCKSTL